MQENIQLKNFISFYTNLVSSVNILEDVLIDGRLKIIKINTGNDKLNIEDESQQIALHLGVNVTSVFDSDKLNPEIQKRGSDDDSLEIAMDHSENTSDLLDRCPEGGKDWGAPGGSLRTRKWFHR